MGYDLDLESGKTFRMSNLMWPMAVELAEVYGWKTENDVLEGMVGLVSKSEAIAMADVLEEALKDIAKHPRGAYLYLDRNMDRAKRKGELLDFWASHVWGLWPLVSFCRQGAFDVC
jgi:hypothetical protein